MRRRLLLLLKGGTLKQVVTVTVAFLSSKHFLYMKRWSKQKRVLVVNAFGQTFRECETRCWKKLLVIGSLSQRSIIRIIFQNKDVLHNLWISEDTLLSVRLRK